MLELITGKLCIDGVKRRRFITKSAPERKEEPGPVYLDR